MTGQSVDRQDPHGEKQNVQGVKQFDTQRTTREYWSGGLRTRYESGGCHLKHGVSVWVWLAANRSLSRRATRAPSHPLTSEIRTYCVHHSCASGCHPENGPQGDATRACNCRVSFCPYLFRAATLRGPLQRLRHGSRQTGNRPCGGRAWSVIAGPGLAQLSSIDRPSYPTPGSPVCGSQGEGQSRPQPNAATASSETGELISSPTAVIDL